MYGCEMLVRAACLAAPLIVLTACPGGAPNSGANGGSNVLITDVAPRDAAPIVTGGDDGPPVQPGSDGDVIGRVFTLGREPTIPPAFGKLKAWMTRAEASRALPADWSGAFSHGVSGEAGVTVAAGDAEATDDPISHLDITFDQAGAAWRLEQAWGAPDLNAYDKSASCWLATSTKLKACHGKQLGRDVIELATYVSLAEALGKSSPRAFATLIARLGQARADVERAFPQHETIVDPDHPDKNRVEVAFPATEYMASGHADRVLLYLDAKDKVNSIAVRFGANDPALRPTLVKEVRAVADQLSTAKDAPSVTVLESEPIDVVVVLDRGGALP